MTFTEEERIMATSKRRATPAKRATTKRATSTKSTTKATGGEFVCPECGRTFGRAAALGAHRSRAHGVAGKSARAASSTGRRASAAKRTTSARANGVNRDALLKTLLD